MTRQATILTILSTLALGAGAKRIMHIPLEISGSDSTLEAVSGTPLDINGHFAAEAIAGAAGNALRFDGYTTFVDGALVPVGEEKAGAMTVSLWVAPETYPIVRHDSPADDKIALATTIDRDGRTGWEFGLGYTGKYSFTCFSGGWEVMVEADDLLPCYEWSHLVAVVDGASKKATLYRNGAEVGRTKCMNTVDSRASRIYIGKGKESTYSGPFLINTFNGLIDDIEVFDTALEPTEFASVKPENDADLSIPASRFADDTLRPRFHGMPAAAWTNECHGMYHSDGRYHLFFQKNANGPYMSRLHWGHISSENLYDWREEKIAIAPGADFDIKGCWSGCVFSDPEVTGGKPAAVYTGVDYAKAMMVLATAKDDALIEWEKPSAPIIHGRPDGLSDDFRDPYFFRDGDKAYIIVGSSKNNIGTTTLHEYNPSTHTWSNDGRTFFSGETQGQDGRFWEMPNVTKMDGDKWLFTVTPLETLTGVHTMYRTGTIADNGTFIPDSGAPKNVELTSKDGFGLLSPTVYQHDGKTIALGIVPDKLSGQDNYNLGWAHCYSLPREWSLAEDGSLIQRPFEGLKGMRSGTAVSLGSRTLDGAVSLNPVSGRAAEIDAMFTVGSTPFGFRFFKGAEGEATLEYNPSTGEMTVDFTKLTRLQNDGYSYNGVYRFSLPERPKAGEKLHIDLFIDHSIIDLFVGDRWATSIRVFPTDSDADGIEVFSDGQTQLDFLDAWTLKGGGSGIGEVTSDSVYPDGTIDVFHLSGYKVKERVEPDDTASGLEPGIYIARGRKFIVK